jgi:type I restriction enzyme S subunit
MRMSKQEKKELVPALRFPEFRNAGAWKKKPLAPYVEEYSERASSNTELEVYSSTREGLKPQSEYYDGRNLVNDGEYGVVPTGHFVYRHMSDDNVFKFNLNQLGKKIAVSKEYPVFKAVNLDARFLINKLNEGQEFKKFAASQKKGGTRTRLYFKTLCTFESFFPDLEEQQKIADCLTSIDELIIAQTQKLEALKIHKKGLTQQLFPAAGETVPKLRFAEFRDKGEWQLKKVSEFSRITTGNKDTQNKVEFGKYPFFVRSQTIERINSHSFDGEAILTAGDGVGVGKIFHYIDGKFDFHQRVYCIYDFKKNVVGKYFYLYFSARFYNRVMKLSAKNSVDSVRMAMIADMEVAVPSLEEQSKIVECLFSLDELITIQTKKIEALKTHKTGLMRHLFPAMDEVVA